MLRIYLFIYRIILLDCPHKPPHKHNHGSRTPRPDPQLCTYSHSPQYTKKCDLPDNMLTQVPSLCTPSPPRGCLVSHRISMLPVWASLTTKTRALTRVKSMATRALTRVGNIARLTLDFSALSALLTCSQPPRQQSSAPKERSRMASRTSASSPLLL